MAKTKNVETTKKVNLRPLMGYVLVEPSAAETKTASGLFLPDSAQEKPAQGTVMAVGNDMVMGAQVFTAPVKVGDTVVYKKWGGDEIKLNGMEYKLVKFEDLMGIIEA